MKIPKKYMAEMFVDRVSAGKIYNGDKFDQKSPLEYFDHVRCIEELFIRTFEDVCKKRRKIHICIPEKGFERGHQWL